MRHLFTQLYAMSLALIAFPTLSAETQHEIAFTKGQVTYLQNGQITTSDAIKLMDSYQNRPNTFLHFLINAYGDNGGEAQFATFDKFGMGVLQKAKNDILFNNGEFIDLTPKVGEDILSHFDHITIYRNNKLQHGDPLIRITSLDDEGGEVHSEDLAYNSLSEHQSSSGIDLYGLGVSSFRLSSLNDGFTIKALGYTSETERQTEVCLDPTASNTANSGDYTNPVHAQSQCEYRGCTSDSTNNFNTFAQVDDGSCQSNPAVDFFKSITYVGLCSGCPELDSVPNVSYPLVLSQVQSFISTQNTTLAPIEMVVPPVDKFCKGFRDAVNANNNTMKNTLRPYLESILFEYQQAGSAGGTNGILAVESHIQAISDALNYEAFKANN
ncbi:hypothetical protein [Photobacterium sp. GSS17]|uniref:hypothetical protein n=1 Tax=Photobacterium sp. GSS17 TaxID=3020715 RepID=UPI00235FF716|nr:hypothetical protein [Photobacterium sp. GSS17]